MNHSDKPIIIYDLVAYAFEEKANRYPGDISEDAIGKYSTLKKAEEAIRSCIVGNNPGKKALDAWEIHSFAVHEIVLDVGPRHWDRRSVIIYDEKGTLHGIDSSYFDSPFAGREPSSCRFHPGDYVEFISGRNKLEIGIVVFLPQSHEEVRKSNHKYENIHENNPGFKTNDGEMVLPLMACDQSDDVYLINYITDDFSHDHLQECYLFRPRFSIEDAMEKRLNERFRFLLRSI